MPLCTIFTKWPGAVGAAVEVALLGRARGTGAPGRALRRVDAGRERGEDRVEVRDDVVLAADHEAEAALEAEHAAARADVDVVDALRAKRVGAVDVVAVVGVAAVDDDVALGEQRRELVERRLDDRGGHHDPDGARLAELGDEVVERGPDGVAPSPASSFTASGFTS